MMKLRSPNALKKFILGVLASTLLNSLVLFPLPGRANTPLGVLRSQENLGEWNQIEQRLQASQIGYQAIDLETLNAASLSNIKILFLPNLESLKSEQVKIIQEWVKQGGKLIASGPVGQKSSPLVRQLLRSIIGSYWAFPLTVPAQPEARKNRCRDEICNVLTTWAPVNTPLSQVMGGVLIPTTLESYTAGIWASSGGSPSVITTEQAVYLGWRWGSGDARDVDVAWLQAAVNRYGSFGGANIAVNQTPATPATPAAANPPQTPTTPVTSAIPATSAAAKPPQTPVTPAASAAAKPPQTPVTPPATATPVNPLPTPAPMPTATRNPPQPSPPKPPTPAPSAPIQSAARFPSSQPPIPETFVDPSEQAAPVGLEVTPGNEPITDVMAVAMRQELVSLLGRFENALIAANSGNTPINLEVASTQLVASAGGREAIANRSVTALKQASDAISLGRQVIKDFPELVAQQNWAEARRQWLEARQQLWQNYPLEGERTGAEIRAVWLDRGTIVRSRSEAGLAQVFDRLAQAGINTVFFETVNAGYPIYPSQVAPAQNPLTVGWNPLASAVKLAHERNMELHAWVWAFAVSNQRHNEILGQPPSYLGPVLEAHPDWANINNLGEVRNNRDKKAYLDPANSEARSYLLRLINEIAQTYQVDGIQLDYIRYPFQDQGANYTYGYGQAGRQQFMQLTGVDPVQISPRNVELWNQWTQFRENQITSFVGEVSQLLKQQHPNVILSVAVFPHPEQERIRKIQQHWEVWAQQGYVDLIVPMTYALDTNRLQRITAPLTDSQRLGATLIAPSVKLLNLPEIVAIDQLQALRDLPTGGYSIFAVETIGNRLQNFFQRTQQSSSANVQSPIPYREPFAAAAQRYLALKREWSFLLANDQLWIRQPELQTLRNQAEELATVLNQLAENPSADQIGKAKQLLNAFQKQFSNAMRLQALERPYQVQSWENRLGSLEMLLRYGERTRAYRK